MNVTAGFFKKALIIGIFVLIFAVIILAEDFNSPHVSVLQGKYQKTMSLVSPIIDMNIPETTICNRQDCFVPITIRNKTVSDIVARLSDRMIFTDISAKGVKDIKLQELHNYYYDNNRCIESDEKTGDCIVWQQEHILVESRWEKSTDLNLLLGQTKNYRLKFVVPIGAKGKFDFGFRIGTQNFVIDPYYISITEAMHLDKDKNFVSDIFSDVNTKDTHWSETIGVNEFVRVSFERELTNQNDITFFAKSMDSNYAIIEIYPMDGNTPIVVSEPIYTENWQKLFLNSMAEGEKYITFDLKVLNSPVQFDYIVDPNNIDQNLWRLDGNSFLVTLPVFNYNRDKNLTFDFNIATDSNYGYTYFDLNYSTSQTQGTGTAIVTKLKVDSNNCQTNFIAPWNNTPNSDSSLLAYWKFDGKEDDVNNTHAMDYSGNGYYAKYYVGSDNNAQGKWDNNAVYLDGNSGYIGVQKGNGQIPDINLTKDFSISFWINWYTVGTKIGFVLAQVRDSSDRFTLATNLSASPKLVYGYYDGSSYNGLTGTTTLTANIWHHVVIMNYSDKNKSIYYDGKLDANGVGTGGASPGTAAIVFKIGGLGTVNSGSYVSMEEIKVYNRILTANEVSLDYNLGNSNFRSCSVDWNIMNVTSGEYFANSKVRDAAGADFNFKSSTNLLRIKNSITDSNIWRVDGHTTREAMPTFSYAIDGNLTIDFNLWSPINYETNWADLNYSTSKTQGTGTPIVTGLMVDGNRCQTNFIGTWNNTPNSDANLVGYWKFDKQEDDYNTIRAFDYSGNGNHGQYSNGADNNASGKWDNNAGFFDGVNDYINMGDVAAVDGLNQMTVSAWFKTSAAVNQTIISKYDSIDWSTVLFMIFTESNGGETYFTLRNSAGTVAQADVHINFQNGDWHQVVLDYNNTAVLVYFDGILRIGPIALAGPLCSVTTPLLIGSYYASGTPAALFNGSIDEVKIYNRALTSDEISLDYNLGVRNHRTCKWDWNIMNVTDANYYANILVRDNAGNSDYNSSNNNFEVNPSEEPPGDTYDFTVSFPSTCTEGKGATSGTNCNRIWLETTDTLPPIDQTEVVPDGQSSGQPIFSIDFTGTAATFDLNMALETTLSSGLTLKVGTANIYANALTLSTNSQIIASNITPNGTQDLNIWQWGDFSNYSVSNGLDISRIIDANTGEFN